MSPWHLVERQWREKIIVCWLWDNLPVNVFTWSTFLAAAVAICITSHRVFAIITIREDDCPWWDGMVKSLQTFLNVLMRPNDPPMPRSGLCDLILIYFLPRRNSILTPTCSLACLLPKFLKWARQKATSEDSSGMIYGMPQRFRLIASTPFSPAFCRNIEVNQCTGQWRFIPLNKVGCQEIDLTHAIHKKTIVAPDETCQLVEKVNLDSRCRHLVYRLPRPKRKRKTTCRVLRLVRFTCRIARGLVQSEEQFLLLLGLFFFLWGILV